MISNEFQRRAPRFLDGTLSDRQLAIMTREVQTSSEAREGLDLLEKETQWIKTAFEPLPDAAAEDLSRILLRVRRRNPYRKFALHPGIALALQTLLGVGLVILIFSLNADLLPPELAIASLDGDLHAPQLDSEGKRELLVGVPIATSTMSQATLSLGGMDDLYLSEDTRVSVLPPKQGIRQVIELDHGEIWTELRQRDTPTLLTFNHADLEGWQLKAENAQLNVAFGSNAQEVMPRDIAAGLEGLDAEHDSALAVLRILSGDATLQSTDSEKDDQTIERGKAYVLTKDGLEVLHDPDASVYRRLRMTPAKRFKLHWDWSNPDIFPLSVDGVTLPIWNVAMTYANTVEDARAKSLSRNGALEVSSFLRSLQRKLDTVGAPADDLKAADAITLADFETSASNLHQTEAEGGKPALLRAMRVFIESAINSAKALDPENIDELHSLLLGQEFAKRRTLSLGQSESERFARIKAIAKTREAASQEAATRLEGHRSLSELDPDGSKRGALHAEILALTDKIGDLAVVRADREDLQDTMRKLLERVDQIKLEKEPLVTALSASESDIEKYQRLFNETIFSEKLLSDAEAKRDELSEALKATESEIGVLNASIDALEKRLVLTNTAYTESTRELALTAKELSRAEDAALSKANDLLSAAALLAELETEHSLLSLQILMQEVDDLESALKQQKALGGQVENKKQSKLDAEKALSAALKASAAAFEEHQATVMAHQNAKSAQEIALAARDKNLESTAELVIKQKLQERKLESAEKGVSDLKDAQRAKERYQRLLKAGQSTKSDVEAQILPLDAKLATEEKARMPLQAKIDGLTQTLAALPALEKAQRDAKTGLAVIKRALDTERRLAIELIHAAKQELETLHSALQQAAALRSALSAMPLQFFPELDERISALFADFIEIDRLDNEITALRSDQNEAFEKLVSEISPNLEQASAGYLKLVDDLEKSGQSVIKGEGSERSIEDLLRRAKLELFSGIWLSTHAKSAASVALSDNVIRHKEYLAWAKKTVGFGLTEKSPLETRLTSLANFDNSHRKLMRIFAKERALKDVKAKKGQSRADLEIQRIEARQGLLDLALDFRNEAPSKFESEMQGFIATNLDFKKHESKLFGAMWKNFHKSDSIGPEESRDMQSSILDAKWSVIRDDFFHHYQRGDRSASGASLHAKWRSALRSSVSKEEFGQYRWLRDSMDERQKRRKSQEKQKR